jgi:GDP/UDP-N,N'-diacetylbacillosamine 2-epimerase (hydrolysing)
VTRLLIVTGTRADLGLWRPVLADAARRGPSVEVQLLAVGMHLDPRFASTINAVRSLNVPIAAEVAATPPGDSPAEMAAWLGEATTAVAPVIARLQPEWVCLLGDRGEQLAAAIAALHLRLAVAHLHGGERTLGAVDDAVRDMISRVAHLHLVANERAAKRLKDMGEEPWRIHVVGAPGLDNLVGTAPASADLRSAYGLPPAGDYLLLLFHPETAGSVSAADDLDVVINAVRRSGLPVLAIGPNADAGGRAMLQRLQADAGDGLVVHTNVSRDDYLQLLAAATALVGNSSSGIIEAPALRVPAVNIGKRQEGRTRGDNVVDVETRSDAIEAAITRARDGSFRAQLSGISPYGDGQTAPRILNAILSQSIDERLLTKQVAP